MTNTFEKIRTSSDRGSTADDRVYLLWHTDAYDDEKLIGVYRTEEAAIAAIDRVKTKPGFSEVGGKFECVRYELNKDHWTEGFIRPSD